MDTVVVSGAIANKLLNGGEAWVRLSWILGLRRLGLDVWFVEQMGPGTAVDSAGEPAPFADSENRRYFDDVVERFGLGERASLLFDGGRELWPRFWGRRRRALSDSRSGSSPVMDGGSPHLETTTTAEGAAPGRNDVAAPEASVERGRSA